MRHLFGPAAAAFLLMAGLHGTAAAEKTITVNDNNTGRFDQPSVAMSGAVAHVAYIGDNTASGNFRVYYAAVNGAADFTNLSLPRDNTVLLAFPVTVDNTVPPNDAYADARHPRIAVRSATEAVIFFQGKPVASPDNAYKPYIARVTLSGNTVTEISVRRVIDLPGGPFDTGHVEDISFGIAAADNTARLACAVRAASAAAGPFQVHFARVGLDNAAVVGTVALSSTNDNSATGSNGFRPVPSLRLDAQNRAHVAWAATDDSAVNPGPVYYALVKAVPDVGGTDNLAIGATKVIAAPRRWAHPAILVSATNAIIVVAADESVPGIAGPVARVQFNPDAVAHTGGPVQANTPATFYTFREESLPSGTYDLYRPEAFLDTAGRIHLTGYAGSGTSLVYYAIKPTATFPFADFVTVPTTIGFTDFPGEIGGSFTKAAFGYVSGKAVVFSSGRIAEGNPNLDLNVTTVPTVTDPPPPSQESGCAMVGMPGAGERGRIPGATLLFLPAAALGARRLVRSTRRARGKAVGS